MALVVMGGLCWLAAAAVPIAIVNEAGPDEIWSAACEPVGIDWCQTQKYWDAKGIEGYRLGPGRCPVMGECDDPVVRDEHLVQPDTLFKTVRMHIHVFREDDGSNSAATEYEVLALFDEINADYAPWRIRFDCTWGFVDDSRYRYGQDIGQMKRTYAISPETTCNVYIIALGYAYGTFPWDPDALTAQGGIAYEETFIDDYSHALSHEMGHCLGLWHTHHGVSEVEQCGPCYEEPEPPCDTTGDFCADTPPTPINPACGPPDGTDPCSGLPWGPTQPENYMSYGGLSPPCWELFTASQAARMHCWIEAALPTWLTCPVEVDCNENLVPDGCDLNECDSSPWCDDCNANGVLDVCDIESGDSEDANGNGIPDECDCWGDLDDDGEIDLSDLSQLLAHYGMTSGATYYDGDLDLEGDVDLADLAALLAVYGTSCD